MNSFLLLVFLALVAVILFFTHFNFSIVAESPHVNGLIVPLLFLSLLALFCIPKNIIRTTGKVRDELIPLRIIYNEIVRNGPDQKISIAPEMPIMDYVEAIDYVTILRDEKTEELGAFPFGVIWGNDGVRTHYSGFYFELWYLSLCMLTWFVCTMSLMIIVNKEIKRHGHFRAIKNTADEHHDDERFG